MAIRVRFFLILIAPTLAQRFDFDYADFTKLYLNRENHFLDNEDDLESLKPLDIGDRSVGDYDTRESPPFEKICEVKFIQVPFWERDPSYEYKNYPMYNATCIDSEVRNPSTYSRHYPHKDFCIIKHQRFAEEESLCKTVFRKIPILKRKRGSECWSYEIQKFGVGCKCHIAIKYD